MFIVLLISFEHAPLSNLYGMVYYVVIGVYLSLVLFELLGQLTI